MPGWSDRLTPDVDPPGRVCCLPDLFLDHLVPLPPAGAFLDDLAEVARRGGGNIATDEQRVEVGGNAANLAFALARLGVEASLVAPTDAEGRRQAADVLGAAGVDVDGVRDAGAAARTVALELGAEEGEGANVMLSDPGPLAGYGPSDLTRADEARVREADVVAVANWAKTKPGGTALLEAVAGLADEADGAVFLDTSDPATRPPGDVEALLASEALRGGVDRWGMNEHEARTYAEAAGADDPDLVEAAEVLAGHAGARVDVHTAGEALTHDGSEVVRAPAFEVVPARRTGAGDAWNAGAILADLLGLDPRRRLQAAHGTAALLVRDGEPPTREELAAFLDERAD